MRLILDSAASWFAKLLTVHSGFVRSLVGPGYRLLPQTVRDYIRGLLVRRNAYKVAHVSPECLDNGITLVGYPLAEFGMGEALRSIARATMAADIPTEAYDFSPLVSARQGDTTLLPILSERPRKRVNVFCVNANLLPETIDALGNHVLEGRYNISRPFWELSTFPEALRNSFDLVDEIWAPTRFVKEAIEARVSKRATLIPMAIGTQTLLTLTRGDFGLPRDAFIFVFAFDFGSYATRKNPLGVVKAFRTAFPDAGDRSVAVVIKMTGNGPGKRKAVAELKILQQQDNRIYLIDRTLAAGGLATLLNLCDCYVSLHRSEGFGLTIAEAMALAKPVIATDYSGSTDFLTTTSGHPVPYRLIEVRKGEYPYYEIGQSWADPDIEAAAANMRFFARNPDEAYRMGTAGKAHILAHRGAEKVGRTIAARLSELGVL